MKRTAKYLFVFILTMQFSFAQELKYEDLSNDLKSLVSEAYSNSPHIETFIEILLSQKQLSGDSEFDNEDEEDVVPISTARPRRQRKQIVYAEESEEDESEFDDDDQVRRFDRAQEPQVIGVPVGGGGAVISGGDAVAGNSQVSGASGWSQSLHTCLFRRLLGSSGCYAH